jgi:hypothetical protein
VAIQVDARLAKPSMTGPPSTNLIRGVWDRSPAHRQWTQRFLLAFNFFDFLAADSAASSKFSNRSLSVSSRTTSGTSAILSVAVPTVCVRWPLQGRAKTLRSTIPVLRSTAITICSPNDLAESRIQVLSTSLAVVQPLSKAGRIKVLAAFSRRPAVLERQVELRHAVADSLGALLAQSVTVSAAARERCPAPTHPLCSQALSTEPRCVAAS